jgi:hypothetical protein
MMAISGLRPAVVLAQVVLTFGAAELGGAAAAAHYQQDQERAAQAAIGNADQTFAARTKQVLDDGTPHVVIDPVVSRHKQLEAVPIAASSFFIDRIRIDARNHRAAATDSLTSQVAAAETQAEVQLNQQLTASIKALRDLVPPAQTIGLDPSAYSAFADATEKANQQLTIPKVVQQMIDQVKAKGDALKQATNDKIAADESARQAALALQTARNSAQASLQAAQAALARAKTIPVLKVADSETAITGLAKSLSDKLAAQAPIGDFQVLSAALRGQAASLNNLVDTRQATYDLISQTRRELDAAQNAKNDVSAERGQLDALAPQLDQAGDIGTINNIKGQVQAIKNSVEAKYYAALYGVGKVIVVSTDQERLVALQDGVVVLNTLVTTGRPSLPTVLGTFHIFRKYSPYCMSSPWPAGSPYYWSGCAKMSYAMEFESSGYFIHDAPWRSHYGPGSDSENGGTHGCVNVMLQQMTWLYNWTPVDTTVITKRGDIPG